MNEDKEQPHIGHTVIIKDEGLRKLKGFVQIPKAVLMYKNVSYGAKVVYGILLHYAWQEDFCFPAQKSIAHDLDCSVRQAQRFLDELKREGFINWKQMGLNRPNVYYILEIPKAVFADEPQQIENRDIVSGRKNKDTTNMSYPDMTHMSYPDAPNLSHQEATHMSYYEDPIKNKQNNVNVNAPVKTEKRGGEDKTDLRKLPDLGQDKEKTKFVADEIFAVYGDKQSRGFYYLVAAKVPESVIWQAISEIKQGSAREPARVFSSRMKKYAEEKLDHTHADDIESARKKLAVAFHA